MTFYGTCSHYTGCHKLTKAYADAHLHRQQSGSPIPCVESGGSGYWSVEIDTVSRMTNQRFPTPRSLTLVVEVSSVFDVHADEDYLYKLNHFDYNASD